VTTNFEKYEGTGDDDDDDNGGGGGTAFMI